LDLDRSRDGLEKKFFDLCYKVVGDEGLRLYDMDYLSGSHLLRVYIMNEKTKSATLDDCVRVDHALTPFMDSESWMPEELTLEVSSPGVYRGLKNLDHFEMALGDEIKLEFFTVLDVKLRPQLPKSVWGQKKIRGPLKSISSEGLVLLIDDKELDFKFSEIKKANLDPEIGKNMRV